MPAVSVRRMRGPSDTGSQPWRIEELRLAVRHGCEPISLGPRILRTETAGIAALAALQAIFGDLV